MHYTRNSSYLVTREVWCFDLFVFLFSSLSEWIIVSDCNKITSLGFTNLEKLFVNLIYNTQERADI